MVDGIVLMPNSGVADERELHSAPELTVTQDQTDLSGANESRVRRSASFRGNFQ